MENQTINNTLLLHSNITAYPDPHEPVINPTFLVLISVGFVGTCVVGCAGNLLLAYTIYRKRGARRTIHLLTLNLVVSDLMVIRLVLDFILFCLSHHGQKTFIKLAQRALFWVANFSRNKAM